MAMETETAITNRVPKNLAETMIGDLPEDCYLGGEYLPAGLLGFSFDQLLAVTQRAILDNPNYHQEIAYAAMIAYLTKNPSTNDIQTLLLATGRLRDSILLNPVCDDV